MGPWNGCAKNDLSVLAAACYKGDIDMLTTLLDTGDTENKYPGDINTHVTEMTPLMYAALNGQIDAVDMMLNAGADPHMKRRMPQGKDPSAGETAQDMAMKMGFDDVAERLKQAESDVAPHKYKRYGKTNNARLTIYKTGETGSGKNPFEMIKLAVSAAKAVKASGPPPTDIALLFPGQGSQYVKMMTLMKDDAKIKEMVAEADAVLGYSILSYCLEGPEDELEKTKYCQPAMFLAGMAGLEKLRKTRPEAVERPGAVAGLSIGEYTALCAAGVFTFKEGMEIVKVRAEAMDEASASPTQAGLMVAGLEQDVVERLCAEQAVGGEVCQIATQLFPKGFGCAGTLTAITKLKFAAEGANAMQAKLLKTGGAAFHTPLMQSAQVKLDAVLDRLLPSMKPPTCDVYMNAIGKAVKAGTPPSQIVALLSEGLCAPVKWEPSIRLMIDKGINEFYEVGPMKQLKAMMKRINATTWSQTFNIEI